MANASGEAVRVFRAWKEGWEKKKVGPKGDSVFEAMLVRKHGGLSWLDCDMGDVLMTANPDNMWFDKKHGNNEYHVHATKVGYDKTKDPAV